MRGAYFAYPIDQRIDDGGRLYQQIEFFQKSLLSAEAVDWTFDPGDAFSVRKGALIDDTLPRINRAALANADLVAAFLPASVPSIGVPIEVDRAVSLGKKVVVFSDAEAWMLNYPNQVVQRYNDWTDSTLLRATDWVLDQAWQPTNQRDPDPLYVTTDDATVLPTRAYPDDAGMDLYVSQDTAIAPGAFCDVPCGLRAALPPWSWGLIVGRSSTLRRRGLVVHPGVIDAGYRGPLFAACWNMTDEVVEVKAGERVAQLIVMHNATRNVEVARIDDLPVSDRGDNGFGSSGA